MGDNFTRVKDWNKTAPFDVESIQNINNFGEVDVIDGYD